MKHSETESYQMAWNIAQAKKPYNDGKFVKKCLCDLVEILSPENNKLKRMISDVQLSRHTVERRISTLTFTVSLLFLIYINDLPNCTTSPRFFVDDTCVIMKDSNLKSLEVKCSNELINIYEWMNANKLIINTAKSQALVIPFKSKLKNVNINIAFNQAQLQILPNLKYLGIYLDKDLNFSKHLNYIESKIARATGILYKCKPYFSSKIL